MAGRKKKEGEGEIVATERAFTVVVEQMKAQFKAFGERLDGMHEAMDARFDAVDARFEKVDARFDAVDRELGLVKDAVLTHDRELREMGRGTR
jgi:hypothetical protein